MAGSEDNDDTIEIAAVVAAGLAVLWLVLRGLGGRGSGGKTQGQGTGGASVLPCRVRIGATGIELDGTPASLDAVVARCRTSAAADVVVTGAATGRDAKRVIDALSASGVALRVSPPDVLTWIDDVDTTNGRAG
jgi:hypothetical protein